MMMTYARRAWRVLLLDPKELRRHLSAPNAMGVSLKLAVAAGLLAGLGELAGIGGVLTDPSPAERVQEVASSVAALPETLPPVLAGIVEPLVEDLSTVLTDLAGVLESVEPPLGGGTSQVLRSVGGWLSTPFGLIGGLLVFALPIMLVARWMGGTGTLRNQTSLLLLAVLPQALTILGSFPISGGLESLADILRVLALWWSIAILVRGLAVANGVTYSRAAGMVGVALAVFFVAAPVFLTTLASVLAGVVLRALT